MQTLGNFSHAAPLERLVFFGTPYFAVPTLEALRAAGRTPELIVSQPTRSVGRGRRPKPPPVAQWAADAGVTLVQTDRVKDADFLAMLRERDLDLAVVVAFGQIFRKSLLELPRFGCMNLHASLLPSYRGAAPIVGALRHGEVRAGVSTMVMERGLDSGPILLQSAVDVGVTETAAELTPRLAALGGQLVVETLDRFEAGNLRGVEQVHAEATYAPMLNRDEGNLNWAWSAKQLHDLVRAFVPWPGTRAIFREDLIVIKRTTLCSAECCELPVADPATEKEAPGTILGLVDDALWIQTGDAEPLGILEVQRPGRRTLAARDFVNGERVVVGELLAQMPSAGTDG